jgi:hypothetical protein
VSDPIVPPKIGASIPGVAHTVNAEQPQADNDTTVTEPLADTIDEIAPDALDLEDDAPTAAEWRDTTDLLFDYDAAAPDSAERAFLSFEVSCNQRDVIADIHDRLAEIVDAMKALAEIVDAMNARE